MGKRPKSLHDIIVCILERKRSLAGFIINIESNHMIENRKVASVLVGGAVAIAIFGMALSAQAVNPLVATCSGSVASTTITWNSNVTGGVTPYTYLWSGADLGGATSSSISHVYGAGLKTAMLSVTDASSTVATTTCAATVASVPVGTTTPPVVHLPPVFKKAQLIITGDDNFLARGLIVTSVGTNSFVGTIYGTTWTIITSGDNDFYLRGGNGGGRFDISQIKVGDEMGVQGKIVGTTTSMVNAKIVRDYSIAVTRPKERHGDNEGNDDRGSWGNTGSSTSQGINMDDFKKSLEKQMKDLQDRIKDLRDKAGKGHDN
jgi:hypothetical protein